MRDAGKGSGSVGNREKLKVYIAVTFLLILIALLSYLAIPQGSGVSACTGLILENAKRACLNSLALSSTNASVCSYLSGTYADSCYSQIAQRTGNSSLCNSIVNKTNSYACTETIAVANSNYSLCKSIGDPYASTCLKGVAVKLDNQSLCGDISVASDREVCLSIIDLRKMLSANDPAYCANVTASTDQNVTNYIIMNFSLGMQQGDFSNSTMVFESLALVPNMTYSARDFCYSIAAPRISESTLCLNIANSAIRSLCVLQSGPKQNVTANYNYTQLIASCAQLGAAEAGCVQAITLTQAIKTMNASMCGSLSYPMSDTCYFSLATAYQNASYCGHMVNASQRSSCLNST